MEAKKWWQSKTILAAVYFAVKTAVEQISTALGHPIAIPDFINQLAVALGLYGLRTADKKIS